MFVEPPLISCSLTFCSLSRNHIKEGAHVVAGALQVNQSLQELKWVLLLQVLFCLHWEYDVCTMYIMYILHNSNWCTQHINQGLIITQGVVLYFTNWQTDTQCLILCLTSEVLKPNIPYTKWRGLLKHLSSLVLWHSAASVGTRSKKKECVHLVRLYEWTRAFRS